MWVSGIVAHALHEAERRRNLQPAPKMSNRKLRNDLEALKETVEKLRQELANKTATPAPVIHYHLPAQPILPYILQPNPWSPGVPWQDTIITCASGRSNSF